MSEQFRGTNEDRLIGASASLAEAARLVRHSISQGICPLSERLVREATLLAKGAAVLLQSVDHVI